MTFQHFAHTNVGGAQILPCREKVKGQPTTIFEQISRPWVPDAQGLASNFFGTGEEDF